jgi:hypothetical protein
VATTVGVNNTTSAAPLAVAVATRAAQLCAEHFPTLLAGGGGGVPETPAMARLRELARSLASEPANLQPLVRLLADLPAEGTNCQGKQTRQGEAGKEQGEEKEKRDVEEIEAEEEDGVSVYELVHSGAVRALTDFLQGVDLQPDGQQPTSDGTGGMITEAIVIASR